MTNFEKTMLEICLENTQKILDKLERLSTIDIVRCIECKHRNTANCPMAWFDEYLQDYKSCNLDNDFCSDGERRDNE